MFTIELGSEVKSTVTDFKGVVVSRSEHLNGCNRYLVQPKVNKEGIVPESWWIDEKEIKVTKKPKTEPKKKPVRTGGPYSHHR